MKQLTKRPAVLRNKADFRTQLADAHSFFNNEELPLKPKYLLEDNPYADKDGLIEFIVGTELVNDPVVMAKLAEQKKILIALTSIVTDYVNRYAERYGKDFRTDPELWSLALSKLPLMGPSKLDQQGYSRRIEGVSIATDFINFILDIAASQGDALNKFKEFLSKQGEALRFGVDSNKDYYKTVVIGVCVEVFKVGNEIVYAPKTKQYRIDFTRENTKWSAACISFEYVDIKFDYKYGANVFDYESLEDPAIKKDFEDFLQKSRKAQIENSSTFFNDDFPVEAPVLAEKAY